MRVKCIKITKVLTGHQVHWEGREMLFISWLCVWNNPFLLLILMEFGEPQLY